MSSRRLFRTAAVVLMSGAAAVGGGLYYYAQQPLQQLVTAEDNNDERRRLKTSDDRQQQQQKLRKNIFSNEKRPPEENESRKGGGGGGIPIVNASWTTNYVPSVKWDHDWDRRSPESLTKPSSSSSKRSFPNLEENNNKESENNKNAAAVVASQKKEKPTASRHILLIRHGQYYEDKESDENQRLTSLGREQASLTGLRLKELEHPYTVLIHSTMKRAVETADLISAHLPQVPLVACDLLREGAPIPPEPPVGHWKPSRYQFFEDGARIEAAFRRYFHRASVQQEKDTYEIVVCHANVIRYFVCRAMQFPPEAWLRMSLHHASVTWLTIRPNGRVSLQAVGDSGHMPPKKLSFR